MSENYQNFGKILVKKLRDENYESYLKQIDLARKISLEDYYNLPRNEKYDSYLQNIDQCSLNF